MKNNSISKPLGIYIHVPFCRSKCPYCDFYSLCDMTPADAYTDAVVNGIKTLNGMAEFVGKEAFSRPVDTVYFGGGTPSVLGAERLVRILSVVKQSFCMAENAEITVECNPSTPDIETFFAACAAAGVNRLSLGMQSAVDAERRSLGRKADRERIAFCVRKAREAGIDNISLDVMLGVPGQTEESLVNTLDFALSSGVPHISAYILKLEEETFFYKNRDRLSLPDDDTAGDLYMLMCGHLEKAGMRHYEISNFCFENRLSRHNMRYWRDEEYLGFGPSAHSFYNGKRFYYERDLEAYIRGAAASYDTGGGDAEECFLLALRTDEGLDLPQWTQTYEIRPQKRFYKELELLSSHGLLTAEKDVIRLTDAGMLLSNSVISSLLSKL